MSEFRAALEQFLAGTLGADEARRRVAAAAAREPQVASAMLAVIEAYRSAGRLTPEFATELQQLVRRSAGVSQSAPAPNEPTRLSAAAPAPPPQSSPPQSAPPPSSPSSAPSNYGSQISLGSVLKGRFVLESIVAGGDKGGMGVVFKALDRIKQEAQDRNPYVAIKVLNEDFKRHPDSMMALQREARRAQTLAHPNIITVYDFDRDGDTVYMAMELLTGSPLDEVIRVNRDKGGLPVKEALNIITQLGRGLSYAHANNIVHSDFKPSNAFLTKDGVVKVLDFGIARATKLPDGEKTRFDAGSLGAMTLPYASCEQFERQDPDPSDDVYALSVVSYELLTGHHPFERPDPDKPGRLVRTDAISARNAKMKPAPAPISGLSRAQWRTLQRGLAFRRPGRPRNAAEFLEGMTPRKVPVGALIAAVVAGVLLLVTTTMLASSYLHKSRLQALTQQLQSTDPGVIATALQALQKYQPDERAPVLLNDAVQGNVINYYINRSREQFNIEAARYDYAGAAATLKEAQSLSKAYEDSRQLTDAIDRLESDRKTAILQQADAFESQLAQGVLIASQGPQNVRSTLATIRQLDPNHPLLNDKRLPIAFANQVRSNIDSNHPALASALLSAGLQFAPSDPGLLDLQDRISQQQSAAQRSAQAGELEQALRPLTQAGATLGDFRAKLPQLQELRRAQPNSAVLLSAQDRLGQLIDPIVSNAVAQHQVNDAQATVNEFAELLPAALLARQRTQIASVTGNTQVSDDATAQLRARVEKESANPQADEASVNTLQRDLQNLASVAGAADPAIEAARTRVNQAFLSQSKRMMASRRFTEAQRTLDLAKQFGLPADQYQAQSSALAQARAQLEADNRARESAAQLDAAKQRVLDQALADRIDVAQAQLADLQKSLPANNTFVTVDAPSAIAEAYLARARRAASQPRFDLALQDAQQAQQAAPNLPEFKEVLQRFQSARDLARSLETVTDFVPLRPQLEQVREAERASGYNALQLGFRRVVIERLNRVAMRDPAEANRLRASAVLVFPPGVLPTTFGAGGRQQQQSPSADSSPLQVTPVETAQNPAPPTRAPTQAPNSTQPTPPVRQQRQPGGVNGQARLPPATGETPATQPPAAETPTVVASAAAQSGPVGPCNALNPSSPALSACRDTLARGGRGPEMVVIPLGLEIGGFAMMRNEASIGEFNVYCTTVKGCTQVSTSDPDLPISSISIDDAQKYAIWLSQATGAKYRLPTEREWRRAAGRMRDPDANCLLPGRSARGTTLRPTTVGNLNEFGLRNVTGNVQEWATTANGALRALGGAIGDMSDTCQAELQRPSNGQPDGRTGFRLLREMR